MFAVPPPPAFGGGGGEDEEEDGEGGPAKRQKVGDVELEPEEEFLAAHPGGGALKVQLPVVDGDDKMHGQVVEVSVASLSLTVTAVKQLLADATGLAANKQKISTPALGFLKDNLTLAYYNIPVGSTLQLGLKERGGRKK